MISIVSGTLNRLDYIKKIIQNTVDSNDKLELVLVDGGSLDGTIEYIKKLNNKRIKLIEVNNRSYYWDFMNLGIKNSKYDYICQWNDDVLLENNWEEVLNELTKEHDLYLFSFLEKKGGRYVIYDNEKEFVLNFGIYNKKIFREIGLYNNSYKYYFCDGDMSYRAKSFGYKYKKLNNIKCLPLTDFNQKIAYMDNEQKERNNYFELLKIYDKKILPDNIEYLK